MTNGDLNNDGHADLAVVNSWGDTVSIFLNHGDGTFATADYYQTGLTPDSITIGDFNADGNADLAVAVGSNNVSHVSVLLGKGDGTFHAPVDYYAGPYPVSVTAADFDSDGRTDLATANFIGGDISMLAGNGDGTFGAPVNYGAGSRPYWITTDDFNADGRADLAVANAGSNRISILLGNGDRSFAPAVDYTAGTEPKSVITGDFNEDGRIDLVAIDEYNRIALILPGNGDGTFGASVSYSLGIDRGSSPEAVTTADFNSDSHADLAVADEDFPGHVSILLGAGDGTFAPALKYGTEYYPGGVTAGDFNGDGKVDLAVTNYNLHNVEILLSSTSCAAARPALSLAKGNVLWDSYGDYLARQLTVNYNLKNTGASPAYNLAIIGSIATNGVTVSTPMPVLVGFLNGGRSTFSIPVKYSVPPGVDTFALTVYATAQDACGNDYEFPGPFPGV